MKRTLYIMTIEPLEKRYTKQWHLYWKQEFSKYFDRVINVDGTITGDKIKKGRFLDINQTNVWKSEQIYQISSYFAKGRIKDEDVIIFADAWHAGVTMIKYMIQLNNLKTKMYGYWHAGTYDPHDFVSQAGLGEWAIHNEIGWMKALDGNFVATKFHKELILTNENILFEDLHGKKSINKKIHVVGFPMDWQKQIHKEIGNPAKFKKEDIIVFPHRKDPEKNPQDFEKLKKALPDYKFVFTMDVTKNKKEYYELLAKSKLVFNNNDQETFGIGTVEAMLLGNYPVVPNRLVFPEMYHSKFICNNKTHMKQNIKYFMDNYYERENQKLLTKNAEYIINQSLKSIGKMAKVMLK